MPTTLKQVREALANAVKNVKTANGYGTDLADDHVFNKYSREQLIGQPDSAYPMCFVVSDRGRSERLPQHSAWLSVDFVLIFVCKQVDGLPDPNDQAETFIDDIEKLLNSDDTLGNTVHEAVLTEWELDSGAIYPEGCALVYLTTRRQR